MKNQPGTMKNHENRPGTMKKQPKTMKNQTGTMKIQPSTMKTMKTDLGRAGISKNVTDKQTEPSYYKI